jgi:hypothetical protein
MEDKEMAISSVLTFHVRDGKHEKQVENLRSVKRLVERGGGTFTVHRQIFGSQVYRDSWGWLMRHVRMPSGRAFIGARLRRALLVGVGVAAISIATAPGALATTMIGNTPPWNGSTITSGFGYGGPPNYFTPTYGQTVTVPATDTKLDSFTFYVDLPTNLIFRGEVYAWDPTTVDPSNPYALGSAIGPALYESGQMQTTSYGSGFAIQPITFNIPGGLPLTAGAQYVLFFTTSRDYAANAGIMANGFVGYTPSDTYSGGDWVYISDGGDSSQWTTVGWWHPALFPDIFFQDDLAFQAIFSSPLPTSKAQCKNGGWKNFGTTFKNEGDCVSFVASGGKNPPSGP